MEREGVTPHYERMKEILQDNPLDIVEVYCPLDICRQRNIDRGDRYETQSEGPHRRRSNANRNWRTPRSSAPPEHVSPDVSHSGFLVALPCHTV
ncbi:MAG: hypothetical protein ABS976_08040 [Rhodococcus sp. (in: high G+C Gram-positive bacteria)]